MSEPIKVGDLVVIVRPRRCGCADSVGDVFTVRRIRTSRSMYCATCGADLEKMVLVADGVDGPTPLWRLKRIPPLSELEGEKRDEEITA